MLGRWRRPYFLMGDSASHRSVVLAEHDGNGGVGADHRIQEFSAGEQSGGIQSQGLFDDGQYRVVMKRSLQTKNADQEIQFTIGQFLIISLTAWDGSNGEHDGGKRTVMAWYNLYLEPEASQSHRCISC